MHTAWFDHCCPYLLVHIGQRWDSIIFFPPFTFQFFRLLSVYCNLQPSIQIWFLPQIAKVTVKIIFFYSIWHSVNNVIHYTLNWYEIETWYRFPYTRTKTTCKYSTILYKATALILYLNSFTNYEYSYVHKQAWMGIQYICTFFNLDVRERTYFFWQFTSMWPN